MTSWADNEGVLQRAREQLAERFPDTFPAIIDTFDIAWSGWEGDSKGALITVDGVPMLVAIDQTIDEALFESEIVGRVAEYRRRLEDTERVLKRYSELAGTAGHLDMHGVGRDLLDLDGGLSAEVRALKWEITKAIVYATEAAAAFDQPAFLRGIGMSGDWLNTAVEKPDDVPLYEYVQVYDAGAKRARWQSLHQIVKEVTQRQRFREW